MTRLHYKPNTTTGIDGDLITKPLMSDRGLVTVRLNTRTLAYSITTVETEEILHAASGTKLTALKQDIKGILADFGVSFAEEVRVRKDKNDITEVANVSNG